MRVSANGLDLFHCLGGLGDRSIATIGRWPWRRALHAQLLEAISAQQPQAIGLDILFSEADADYPLDDALLAQAIAASHRVALPVLQRNYAGLPAGGSEGVSELPLDMFTQAAAALGHVHVAPDGDGVVRGLYLQEGPGAVARLTVLPCTQRYTVRAPATPGISNSSTTSAASMPNWPS